MTGLPAGLKIEVEFTAGVFTDITSDTVSFEIKVGRTSPGTAPQTSTCTLVLDNATGKFTPGLQVLTTGVAAPYYPNITPNVRVKVSNSAGVRWLGYVLEWLPSLVGGVVGQMTVNSVDVFDRLSRVTMQTPIAQEATVDGAIYFWPLTDPAGSIEADEAGGGPQLNLIGPGPGVTFGSDGPPSNDGTGVQFNPDGVSAGQLLSTYSISAPTAAFTFECWIRTTVATNPSWASFAFMNVLEFRNTDYGDGVGLSIATNALSLNSPSGSITDAGVWTDTSSNVPGGWGYAAITYDGTNIKLYTGGGTSTLTLVGSRAESFAEAAFARLTLGESASPNVVLGDRFGGWLAGVGFYDHVLTTAVLSEHSKASQAFTSQTPALEVARLLRWGGIDSTLSANYTTNNTSTIVTGSYPQDGVDLVAAIQDWAVTEGGGAVVYVDAGVVVFNGRDYRNNPTPTLTVDAAADADAGGGVDGRITSAQLVNSVTVNWANRTGTRSTATVSNAASIAQWGLRTGPDITSYASQKVNAVRIARDYLNPSPGFEFPSVSVDLFTAQNNLYAAVAATKIGSRLRVTNLPVVSGPSSIVDVIVEGWTETGQIDAYSIQYDTSPADTPTRGLWDNTTYGRWPSEGFTLNGTITATATTLAVAFPAGHLGFDTSSAGYPFNIQIGAEVITLTAPPAGSTSPQTLTGVTRGVSGTAKSAHTAGVGVRVWPVTAWTL